MLQRFHKCLSSGCPRFPLPLLVSGSAVKLVVLKNPERAGGQVVSGCIRDNASGESLLAKPASRENYDDGLIGTSPFCTWDTAFSSLALPLRTTSNWRMGKILAEADRAGSISPVTARGDQGLGDRGRRCDLAGPVVPKRAKRALERSPRRKPWERDREKQSPCSGRKNASISFYGKTTLTPASRAGSSVSRDPRLTSLLRNSSARFAGLRSIPLLPHSLRCGLRSSARFTRFSRPPSV